MRKLRLDPDSLVVQSFDTRDRSRLRGTVIGLWTEVFDGCTYPVGCGSNGNQLPSFCGYQCGSDNPGCGGTDWETCGDTVCPTCDTCAATCVSCPTCQITGECEC